ncbi:MAG: caspase family protein [Lewinellaceae bacterium]|nr:caspase family protein [Saprospiraceae bacterium]MCB9331721.1 caspase family protein [Lewinellaceae bacterium]
MRVQAALVYLHPGGTSLRMRKQMIILLILWSGMHLAGAFAQERPASDKSSAGSPAIGLPEAGKGATPLSAEASAKADGTTRAVVVGISDYQDPAIPDLKYADRDAAAFAAWLQSPAGGNIPKENILLHTNKAATNAQMILSLDWLIIESKAGDRAFIYFSGHGDVERITKYNNGYLLGYDSPPAVYGAGAFAVNYLKDIIATLSDNGVQVFLISDACRAGKLAGSNTNGAQVTSNRLAQQFANEIKILSCQPNEFSIEGEQWGGGRGCFSYHLENALYGFADKDTDSQISLMELDRYLQDNVSAAAAPESQIPMVQGPPKTVVTYVDAPTFAARQEALKNHKTEFLAIDNRGVEEMVLANADSSIQGIYQLFLAAIDANQLMAPEGKSANDYYEMLMANLEIEKLHGTIKRKFVVALMDEGQAILNRILKTDQVELDNIWANRVLYDHLPAYFERATEILGENHYAWRDLKAKEYYFKAMTVRKENYPDSNFAWLTGEKRIWLEKSLEFDSTAAITFYELGNTFPWGSYSMLNNYEKAATLAPGWALIYYRLGKCTNQSEAVQAIQYFKQAITLDSNFLGSYNWISLRYDWLGQLDSAMFWQKLYVKKFRQKMEQDPGSIKVFEYNDVGNALWRLKDYEQAKSFLLQGEKMSEGKFPGIYGNLIAVYTDLLEFENTLQTWEKAKFWSHVPGLIYFYFLDNPEQAFLAWEKTGAKVERWQIWAWITAENPLHAYELAKKAGWETTPWNYFELAEAARFAGLEDTAKLYFRKIIEQTKIEFKRNDSQSIPGYVRTAIAYSRLGMEEEFHQLLESARENLNDDPWFQFSLARIYAQTGAEKAAIESFRKAIELGWQPNPLLWLHGTVCDPMLYPICEREGFKELVQEHFPKYFNIATRVPGKRSKN